MDLSRRAAQVNLEMLEAITISASKFHGVRQMCVWGMVMQLHHCANRHQMTGSALVHPALVGVRA
jgi:hypothetical protein